MTSSTIARSTVELSAICLDFGFRSECGKSCLGEILSLLQDSKYADV